MEALFQYRRIRKQLEQQLARHNARPDEKDDARPECSPRAPSDPESNNAQDVEKEAAQDGRGGTRAGEHHRRRNNEEMYRTASSSRESVESVEAASDAFGGRVATSLGHTRQLSRTSTTQSKRSLGTDLGHRLTGVNVRDRTTKEGGNRDEQVFVVEFGSDQDLLDAHKWSYFERIKTTLILAMIAIIVGIASSIDSEALRPAAEEFGVSMVTESLATGIYLIGFGAGSLLVAPFSETFGRIPVYICTLILFAIWIMASALAPNIGGQLAFRFLAGVFGSTPLTCAGGSIADMWSPMERTLAFPVFANAAFTGPVIGPVMGGYIADSAYVSWRWVEWTSLIGTGITFTAVFFFMPETFSGTLLTWKAKHLRSLTGDHRYASPLEVTEETFRAKMQRALSRPFILAFQEPIIILISFYLTVVYIILFTFLDGYDYIFGMIHETSQGVTGLLFLGIIVGLFVASGVVWPVWILTKRDLRAAEANGKNRIQPESRLWTAMLGGSVAVPISLFWMGWTSYPYISIWSPILASVLFGYGILCVFISSYMYIIDSYEVYSASALAFATLTRYVAAGGMVVVGVPFYENLGVQYTLTILACISAVAAPLPYIFYVYGPAIRKRSKYAVQA